MRNMPSITRPPVVSVSYTIRDVKLLDLPTRRCSTYEVEVVSHRAAKFRELAFNMMEEDERQDTFDTTTIKAQDPCTSCRGQEPEYWGEILISAKDAFRKGEAVLLGIGSPTKDSYTEITKRVPAGQNFLGHSHDTTQTRPVTLDDCKLRSQGPQTLPMTSCSRLSS